MSKVCSSISLIKRRKDDGEPDVNHIEFLMRCYTVCPLSDLKRVWLPGKYMIPFSRHMTALYSLKNEYERTYE